MNILHLIDSGGLYGAEMMLLSLMEEQINQGQNPVLCSMNSNPGCEKEIEKEAERRNLSYIRVKTRRGLDLMSAYRIIRYAKKQKIKILHSHGYKPSILLGIFPLWFRKIPLLYTCHGWTNTRLFSMLTLYEWLDIYMLRTKNAIVFVNKKMLSLPKLRKLNSRMKNIYVIDNGINTEPLIPTNDSTDASVIERFLSGSFAIASIGRLSNEKGYNFLIDSLRILRSENIDAKLVLMGEGPVRSQLEEQVKNLNLHDHVLFTGYIGNARKLLSRFDVYVISSLTEGLPITLLEAMLENVPVVCTKVGGIPDVIRDGENGLLITPCSAINIAHAINVLHDDPLLRLTLGNNASNHIKQHYSSSLMSSKYYEVYESTVNHLP